MSNETLIEELKAIAHPLRFQILESLRGGELNVGEIEQASGIGQPALSQQLSVLRRAGLVDTRKSAKLVFYSLNQERLSQIGTVIGGFDTTPEPVAEDTRTPSPGVAKFARLS